VEALKQRALSKGGGPNGDQDRSNSGLKLAVRRRDLEEVVRLLWEKPSDDVEGGEGIQKVSGKPIPWFNPKIRTRLIFAIKASFARRELTW
jgi:hypothetical protein